MKRIFLLLLAVAALSACRKELDLDAGACFGVHQLLHSKNAWVKCGERADFENKLVCIKGILEPDFDMENSRRFFLLDEKDNETSITVTIDSLIAPQATARVRAGIGRRATVTGIVSGFDMPMNLKCKRGYSQHLEILVDLIVE